MISGPSGRQIGEFSNGSHLEVMSAKAEDKLHGGNTIKLEPKRTTTVTGTLNDTNKVAVRGEQMPGVTQMGSNAGGVNILRSPEWGRSQAKYGSILEESKTLAKEGNTFESAAKELEYWKSVTDEFWDRVNKPWLVLRPGGCDPKGLAAGIAI